MVGPQLAGALPLKEVRNLELVNALLLCACVPFFFAGRTARRDAPRTVWELGESFGGAGGSRRPPVPCVSECTCDRVDFFSRVAHCHCLLPLRAMYLETTTTLEDVEIHGTTSSIEVHPLRLRPGSTVSACESAVAGVVPPSRLPRCKKSGRLPLAQLVILFLPLPAYLLDTWI